MNRAYLVGGLICLVCLAVGFYYLVPGVNHVLTFSGAPTDRHVKHALAFFGLAVVALVGSRFAANADGTL
jgi:hypothetical protein